MAMSVNMLRCRFFTDAQPRSKKGQPPQSTTGVASASCTHASTRGSKACCTGWPGIRSDMPRKSSGSVRTTPTQNRRVMLSSSGSGSSSGSTVRGSSAMPQMGHAPGSLRTICGCMGHTHSVRAVIATGCSGSSAMPHLGQAPGWSWRTSGSIGQIHIVPGGASTGSAWSARNLRGSAAKRSRHFGLQK